MDSVIFVRHGNFGGSYGRGLTDGGREDIRALAKVIGSSLEGKFYLASSGLPRTNESAEIIRDVLCLDDSIETMKCLDYQAGDLDPSNAEAIALEIDARSSLADHLILNTHYGVVHGMPRFLSERSGIYFSFPKKVQKGQAVYCDWVMGDSTLWTPKMGEGIPEPSSREVHVPESHQYIVQGDFFGSLKGEPIGPEERPVSETPWVKKFGA
jgi:hypothetical protein